MSQTGIVRCQNKIEPFLLIGNHAETPVGGSNIFDSRFHTFLRFCSLPGGTPIARAVAGINCMSPLAPAQDTAVVSKLDSVYANDASIRQSQPMSLEYFLNKWS